MNRRQFIKRAGLTAGLSAATTSTVFSKTNLPSINWRLASAFPKNLSIIYGTAERLAEQLNKLTEGRFTLQIFAANEIVPASQVFDAVQQGTIEMGHVPSNHYHGKNRALSIDTTLPFGLTTRMHNAWYYAGGGKELLRELFAKYNIVNFLGGNSNTQMGGWFRKEINTLEDLKGLKFRIPGFGGEILSRLGVISQHIAATDIYSSLERGTIDAVEFIGPFDDEKMGLQAVAPYYYAPGFAEGAANLSFYVNQDQWEKLPDIYKIIFENACAEVHQWMITQYDAHNPRSLATLIKNGAKLRAFSQEILQAAYDAAQIIYDEESKRNPDFAKIYIHWKAFHNQEYQWLRVNENLFQQFMLSQLRRR